MIEPRNTPHQEVQNELQLLQYLVARGKLSADVYIKEQESVIRLAKAMRRRAERMRQLRLEAMKV